MRNTFTFIVAATALLAGCATEYHPRNSEGGYSEAAIEPGVWRVKVDATPYTMPQQVQDYSLLRSAELTLQQGYSHFTLSAPPGPEVVVRMFRQRPTDAAQYEARAVCDRLGTLYEVQCK
ncbi:hypothetical protein GJ697_02070 [Pseudoduganella sp. FT25W]|uniref:Lipoprotein n=1 Tax=Duganella alba TaxID=2666081 RepID=A0A6L5QAS1_9BURK|nr:hypothetical protein [Duganella alba]MRX06618.1 hypothetical protein [Duganella alba]MRX18032.1 hypothetical protein [Duganella alba]